MYQMSYVTKPYSAMQFAYAARLVLCSYLTRIAAMLVDVVKGPCEGL